MAAAESVEGIRGRRRVREACGEREEFFGGGFSESFEKNVLAELGEKAKNRGA